jgi:endonuclease/exonuclease/phosphatase family metal-dependent hydrolase
MAEVTLATWNMLHAPGDRLEALYDVLAGIDADAVAVQEVDDVAATAVLAGRLGMTLFVAYATRPESPSAPGEPPMPEHVALLSRLPVRRAQAHPGDRTAMCRPVLEAWLDVPGVSRPVGLFAVHLRALAGPEGSAYKARETAALRTVLADAPGPHLVVGDFNAWMPGHAEAYGITDLRGHTVPEDHRRAFVSETMGGLLADGYRDALEGRTGEPPAPSMRGRRAPRVDNVLVTPDLFPAVVDARILASESVERASDHHAVVVRLRFAAD